MRGAGLSREPDVAFQEQVRKAASAIVEEETSRIQKSERAEQRKRSIRISPATVGLWLLLLGAGLALYMPSLGAALIVCGIAAMVWAIFVKPSKT